ncbi:peptidyl-prolyl cis-trans isomerase, cyclophilin-type [Chitinivibrio alkaliphilus ACht1]|uniref:peptidylprolyl isomerase n=2 Tax=Chitinivibrio TaxID=1505231 RepID=U7DA33_9BACT|nr:peptidyl-prolyl cis-trans isomerase, cyclophilin-type [Chitinivibrio alkaliphilus ACht1]
MKIDFSHMVLSQKGGRMNKIGVTILLGLLSFAVFSKESSVNEGVFAQMKTSKGSITIQLYYDKTPLTVANFVGLAEGNISNTAQDEGDPFYDRVVFHRVVDGFVVQGGDPTGTGRGGPGYQFPDEIVPGLTHSKAGILSMANAGPGTNGSQFFITLDAQPHLDGKHTVFGEVVSGMDVVNSLRQGDTIRYVDIERVGSTAQEFSADQDHFDQLLADVKEEETRRQEKERDAQAASIAEKYPDAQKSEAGFFYIREAEGTGDTPQKGATVSVHYTGSFLDGQVFDSSRRRGTPLEFSLGMGEVISGWDAALLEMKQGEKRTIILPPELAYGEQGAGGVIPPNAWLVFEVELIDF